VQILGSFLYGFAAVYVVHDLGAVDLVPGGERARRIAPSITATANPPTATLILLMYRFLPQKAQI
jgi:hypothetical protein